MLCHSERSISQGCRGGSQGHVSSWTHVCFSPPPAVPVDQQHLVTKLQSSLESSVVLQSPPNPSILIALNLAGAQNSTMENLLVQQIIDRVIQNGTAGMTSGEVALYILALLSSCKDPKNVTPEINLVEVLKCKTDEELAYLSKNNSPKTTFYQLGLDTLALCLEGADAQEAAVTLARLALAEDLSVDTGAMVTLALTCVHDGLPKAEQSRIQEVIDGALSRLQQQILKALETNTANIYSVGLALQALTATSASYPSRDWSCSQTLTRVLTEISRGAFNNPMAAAQILPSLVGQTYLSVTRLSCPSDTITVKYTIINHLRGTRFENTTTVSVPNGSVLLSVLQEAKQKEPQIFSYETEQTSWGLMVVSINHRAASTNDRTFWQFFNGTKPLDQGVDSYIPSNNEHIKAIFSTY
ncbi:cobalamin binding intrinsic factor [Pelodiscus sinensis]|uniref:cobalamin binding intrinsic factor n=1 Tax=Pelodiscus sinensis TaxID=13735 RepID=UPI003F6CCBFC